MQCGGCDPAEDNIWYVEAAIDLREPIDDGPIVTLVDIRS